MENRDFNESPDGYQFRYEIDENSKDVEKIVLEQKQVRSPVSKGFFPNLYIATKVTDNLGENEWKIKQHIKNTLINSTISWKAGGRLEDIRNRLLCDAHNAVFENTVALRDGSLSIEDEDRVKKECFAYHGLR